MRRKIAVGVVAGLAMWSASSVLAKNVGKSCALFVSTDGTSITDPAHASCQAGGKIALVFCNDSNNDVQLVTMPKTMKDIFGKSYATLKNDITVKKIVSHKCDFGQGQFEDDTKFGSTIPYGYFKYQVTADSIKSLDPDLDVAGPTGIEFAVPGRGRARGRDGR